MPIQVDQSYLPAILVSYEGAPTDEEFDAHLETLRASLTARDARPRVVITDATLSEPAPATQRRRQAAWMKENAPLLRRLMIGCAFVIPSPVVRGILTAILWVQPLPSPHVVCATLDEALDWTDEKLRASGLALPLGARTAWLRRRAREAAR